MFTLSWLIAHGSFKVGCRHLWDACSRLGGSLDSTSSGHLFVIGGDMQSCMASLGVLSKWHKREPFCGAKETAVK